MSDLLARIRTDLEDRARALREELEPKRVELEKIEKALAELDGQAPRKRGPGRPRKS